MTAWQLALQNLATLPVVNKRDCLYCGAVIVIEQKQNQIYCSAKCKVADSNRRSYERRGLERKATSST